MIHPTAVVDPSACLAADVEVGPYAVIGPHVEVGAGTRIGAHVVLSGHTRIGRDNHIHPFCSLGAAPQDKKYRGEATRLEIGDRNVIRECCTFNRGTAQDHGETRIGDDNWVMAYVHIAHDCVVGHQTVFANNASLAGHVEVGDYAVLGGFTGVHQFCRIGAHVMTAIATVALKDIPPFVTASGNPAEPHGINTEGLKRRGFSAEAVQELKRAYRTLYRSGLSLDEALAALAGPAGQFAEISLLSEFVRASGRGIIR